MEIFNVKLWEGKSCFIYLSERRLHKLNVVNLSTLVVQIQWKESMCAYFSCSPFPLNGINDDDLCLNASYAHILGIEDNEQVNVSFITYVQSLSRVYITPVSLEDYEILALSYDTIQSSLLDQIRIVWKTQRLVIWLSSSFCINIYIDKLEPEMEFGKLESFTEVVVLSPENNDIKSKVYDFENIDTPENDAVQDSLPSEDNVIQNEPASIEKTLHDRSSWIDYLTRLFSMRSKDESCAGDVSKQSCVIPEYSLASHSKVYSKHVIVCRVHPLNTLLIYMNTNMKAILEQPCNIVLIHRCNFSKLIPKCLDITADEILTCKITKLTFEINSSHESIDSSQSKSQLDNSKDVKTTRDSICIYSKLYIIEDMFKTVYHGLNEEGKCLVNYSAHNCLYLNNLLLRESLNVTVGAKVSLEIVPTNVVCGIIEIGVKPVSSSWDETAASIETFCRNHFISSSIMAPYLINSNTILKVVLNDAEVELFMKILHPNTDYIYLTSVTAATCKIKLIDDVDLRKVIPCPEPKGEKFNDATVVPTVNLYSGIKELVENSIEALHTSLLLHPSVLKHKNTKEIFKSFNVLLIGKSGMGKTFFAKNICERLSLPPYYVHSQHIQCRHLKGKNVESIEKLLVQQFSKCLYFEPSVIILDDIDALVPSVSSPEENSAGNNYYCRLGERIVELLKEYQSLGHIAVLGTASSLNKINSAFVAPRGCQIFKLIIHIPELTKENRLQLLQQIVKHSSDISPKSVQCVNMDLIAQQCDGYVIQDLLDLVNKSVFEAWRKSGTETLVDQVILRTEDIENTLKSMVPLSLRGVELFQSSPLTWEDLGGLKDVKQSLLEVFYWPSQYPELFDRSPLRHQSGLLLYGAPGTGKTLLAGVVAHECGLKFISVKGPELLSKYIGASEEGVRNIFQKAQSAKPCILFFDEFDSLAPRRGHDSTGVTDRVVNQLLTQLDGVESLNGVWVMAATSRPDLLDPALLRPGRLDKAIYCSLPSLEDRLSILQALSRNLNLSEDVDLRKIAENSNQFTGADLHAVMYTAQLMAFTKKDITGSRSSNLPDLLPANEDNVPTMLHSISQADNTKSPIVSQVHLLAALQDTRPSLSVQERHKYHNIYKRFMGKKEFDFGVVSQRATLA